MPDLDCRCPKCGDAHGKQSETPLGRLFTHPPEAEGAREALLRRIASYNGGAFEGILSAAKEMARQARAALASQAPAQEE